MSANKDNKIPPIRSPPAIARRIHEACDEERRDLEWLKTRIVQECGELPGVSESTLRAVTEGRQAPNLQLIAEIADRLNSRLDWLVAGVGDRRRASTDLPLRDIFDSGLHLLPANTRDLAAGIALAIDQQGRRNGIPMRGRDHWDLEDQAAVGRSVVGLALLPTQTSLFESPDEEVKRTFTSLMLVALRMLSPGSTPDPGNSLLREMRRAVFPNHAEFKQPEEEPWRDPLERERARRRYGDTTIRTHSLDPNLEDAGQTECYHCGEEIPASGSAWIMHHQSHRDAWAELPEALQRSWQNGKPGLLLSQTLSHDDWEYPVDALRWAQQHGGELLSRTNAILQELGVSLTISTEAQESTGGDRGGETV